MEATLEPQLDVKTSSGDAKIKHSCRNGLWDQGHESAIRVRTDGAKSSPLELEMKLVDTGSSCPSNYHGAGKVFCSDETNEALLAEN